MRWRVLCISVSTSRVNLEGEMGGLLRRQTVLELFSTFDSLASIHNVTASQLPKLWDLLNCMLNRTSLLTLGFRTREFSILLLYYLPLHLEFV